MTYNGFFALLFLLISFNSFSYDGTRCKENLYLPTTKKMGSGPSTWLVISTIAPTSTSQFVSSTGSCSATRDKKGELKEFFTNNLEPFKIDSAKGTGEYLLAYSELLSCDMRAEKQLFSLIKKNFTVIYGENLNNSPEVVFDSLKALTESDAIISAGCNLKM